MNTTNKERRMEMQEHIRTNIDLFIEQCVLMASVILDQGEGSIIQFHSINPHS